MIDNTDALSRVLVTGHTGFVGVHALRRIPGAFGFSVAASHVDIRDKAALVTHLADKRPDRVLHLAAQSFVPESFRAPRQTFETNFLGTLNLLEALAETGFTGRFLFVGTGDAYGLVTPAQLPIAEDIPLRPRNPYAVSKAAAEALCFQWSQTGPFEVMMVRPFNHIGAGQAPSFAISGFARQIAEIAKGIRPPQLRVGNIEVTRDFTAVEDVVDAYAQLLERGKNGEIYNICSGIEHSIQDLLSALLALAGVEAEVVVDPERYRPAEQPRVCGDSSKLQAHTGWRPTVPLQTMLQNIYRYWEQEIGK